MANDFIFEIKKEIETLPADIVNSLTYIAQKYLQMYPPSGKHLYSSVYYRSLGQSTIFVNIYQKECRNKIYNCVDIEFPRHNKTPKTIFTIEMHDNKIVSKYFRLKGCFRIPIDGVFIVNEEFFMKKFNIAERDDLLAKLNLWLMSLI